MPFMDPPGFPNSLAEPLEQSIVSDLFEPIVSAKCEVPFPDFFRRNLAFGIFHQALLNEQLIRSRIMNQSPYPFSLRVGQANLKMGTTNYQFHLRDFAPEGMGKPD